MTPGVFSCENVYQLSKPSKNNTAIKPYVRTTFFVVWVWFTSQFFLLSEYVYDLLHKYSFAKNELWKFRLIVLKIFVLMYRCSLYLVSESQSYSILIHYQMLPLATDNMYINGGYFWFALASSDFAASGCCFWLPV